MTAPMPEDADTPPAPVVVPPQALSREALRGVVEAFVLREGTDYGERDVAFEDKVAQVLRQLDSGEAEIVFDPTTESVGLVPSARRPASRPPR
ncbi:MAG: YheU family protein [Proteobacteria bacterium]|nr:YheU family protein [Pseudomonadota bacterium]